MVMVETRGVAAFAGRAASRGCGRGRARWVDSPEEAMALPEGIVVLAGTLPAAWVLLLAAPAAVVVANGGALANAATVLRERGVPAVFGVGEGLRGITDGEFVEVDGATGSIAVLGRSPSP